MSADPTPGEVGLSEAVRALLNDGASGGYWSDGSAGWVRGIREDRLRALLDAHSTTAGASGELTEDEREALTLAMCAPDPDRAPVTEIQLMYLVAAVERIVAARLAARDAEVEGLQHALAKRTGSLDMAIASARRRLARAEAAEKRVRELRAALLGARDDIRDRRKTFRMLGADEQYLSALDDAFGLVNNRAALGGERR